MRFTGLNLHKASKDLAEEAGKGLQLKRTDRDWSPSNKEVSCRGAVGSFTTRRFTRLTGVRHQWAVVPSWWPSSWPQGDKRQKCAAGSNSHLYSSHLFSSTGGLITSLHSLYRRVSMNSVLRLNPLLSHCPWWSSCMIPPLPPWERNASHDESNLTHHHYASWT